MKQMHNQKVTQSGSGKSHLLKSDNDCVYNWPRKRLRGQRYILSKNQPKYPPSSLSLSLSLPIVFPFGFIGVETKMTLVCPPTCHPLTDYHQFTTRMIKSIHVFRSMDRVYLFFTPGVDQKLDCVFNRVHILGLHIFGTLG